MNYLIKNIRNKKLSIDLNSKPKKHQISFSSLVFRSNLINLNENTISPNKYINENRKIIRIKNNTQESKNNDTFEINNDKSVLNNNSTRINKPPNIINNYIKRIYLDSMKSIKIPRKNKNNINNTEEKIITNKKDSIDSSPFNIESNNKEMLNISNNKEKVNRCRHKQVKREIKINNNINNKYNKNKINKLNEQLKEEKNKSTTIPINKKINNQKIKNAIFDCFLMKKKNNKEPKSFSKYKENKENIEQNDNLKNKECLKISVINKKIKRKISQYEDNKNIYNSISKIQNLGKTFENKYYKKNSKEDINIINKRKEKNNEIYFNENELNESNTKINKVLYFETSTNGLFNQFKMNNIDNNISNLSKIHSCKNIKDKKESCSTVVSEINNDEKINKGRNDEIKNINSIIKNNLNYSKNKKNNIINRKNNNHMKFRKYKTDAILNTAELQKHVKKVNKNNNKVDNLDINQNYYTSENKTNSLTINIELMKRRKRFKSINLNIQNKKKKIFNKDLFYKLFENKNIQKILFSFCEKDIYLLNKMSLISKQIYKSIKPFIYTNISKIIRKYNKDNKTKNNIKRYLMKNNCSLLKLSPIILRKKYTDLIFENNKYDIEIKKDLTRTFPDNSLFKYGNIYYNKLYHILTGFSNFNKDIGYAQGLNFLAAHIIYIFEDEIDEFTFLDAMVHKFELDKILDNKINNEFFEKKLKNINNYLEKQLPKLNKFLSDNKLNMEFFITNWILTLFSDSMETEFLIIIWDYLIIFGLKFFKYFILNVLILFESEILNSSPNNITYIKKNILRNEKFNNNNDKLINDTIQMIINDENII